MGKFLVSTLLLPPTDFILVLLVGILLIIRYKRLGLTILAGGAILAYSLSIPLTAQWLVRPLQLPPLSWDTLSKTKAQAMVVLGGGTYDQAPEYRQAMIPSSATLSRLQYAAYLYRQTHYPILVSGGDPSSQSIFTEAYSMAKSLKEDFGVPVRWKESKSEDTYQNAQYASAILKASKVQTVLLVTDAAHMRRAQWAFEHFDMRVIPASTRYMTALDGSYFWRNFIPSSSALSNSYYCLHEYLGLVFYWMKSILNN